MRSHGCPAPQGSPRACKATAMTKALGRQKVRWKDAFKRNPCKHWRVGERSSPRTRVPLSPPVRRIVRTRLPPVEVPAGPAPPNLTECPITYSTHTRLDFRSCKCLTAFYKKRGAAHSSNTCVTQPPCSVSALKTHSRSPVHQRPPPPTRLQRNDTHPWWSVIFQIQRAAMKAFLHS